MAILIRAFAATVLLASTATFADAIPTKESIVAPPIGDETRVTAGSQMFERTRGLRYPAVKVSGAATSRTERGTVESIADGQLLTIDRDDKKKVRACVKPNEVGLCLIDIGADGSFDQINDWLGMVAGKLPAPVPYERGFSVVTPQVIDGFSQSLIYLGMAGQTLRLSYREFVNDMARPAFTEEVTFTLSGKYPETVAYKDLTIDILGADNSGLRYVIRKAAS